MDMSTPTFTDRTAEITYRGQTRTVRITTWTDSRGHRNGSTEAAFVGTIGRGSAKYPTNLRLWEPRPNTPAAQRFTDSNGDEWMYSTNVVIRNRQALVSGWAEEVTNHGDQTRVA